MFKALLPVLLAFIGFFSLSLVLVVPIASAIPCTSADPDVPCDPATFKEVVGEETYQGYLESLRADNPNNATTMTVSANSIFGAVTRALIGSGENEGAVGFLTQSVVAMYTKPPADTATYVADLFHGAGIATPAYAQGFGFAALSPVLETWRQFRNLAYLFFVIIFIVIGFMVMLRRRIGQTAVTAQQAIPQVIIALLAVTFSYAIAGLLLDAMYLIMFLLIGLFGKTADAPTFMGQNVFSFGFALVRGAAGTAKDAVSDYVDSVINIPVINAGGLDFLSGITAAAIIAIAVAVAVFGIFFELLKTYVTIIMQIILAPIALMLGAIPGRSAFGPWVRSLIGNLAAFPILLVVLLVFDMLTGGISSDTAFNAQGGINIAGSNTNGIVYAQDSGINDGRDDLSMPYISTFNIAGATKFLIGLGLLFGAKEAIVQGKKALGAGEGGMMGAIIGAGLKRAWDGRKQVGRGMEAIPVGLQPGLLRTSGKETALERFLVGSRADRKQELKDAERFKGYIPQQGGVYGRFFGERQRAKRSGIVSGGGAGAAAPPGTPVTNRPWWRRGP